MDLIALRSVLARSGEQQTNPALYQVVNAILEKQIQENQEDINYFADAIWHDIPFDAANFTGANAMTWTLTVGDIFENQAMILNKLLIWSLSVRTTSVGGVVDTILRARLPLGGRSRLGNRIIPMIYSDNGGALTWGRANMLNNDASNLLFQKIDASNWTASANLTRIDGTFIIPIQ